MISILLTAWKEVTTISKAIQCIVDSKYSGIQEDFELLLAAPDLETQNVAFETIKSLGISHKFQFIEDPCKGKPIALNMLFEIAKGDILVLTDGDVYFDKNAVFELISEINKLENIGGVSGRPVPINYKNNSIFDYWAHLQADAVHNMRQDALKKDVFFPMSGYIMAIRNINKIKKEKILKLPDNLLLDDAYISYFLVNLGYKISYAPNARAFVKYPTNFDDFVKQKLRSLIGFEQLKKYKIIPKQHNARSFLKELKYFKFPITYSKNIKEFFWSLLFYPVRLYLWIKNNFKRRMVNKLSSIRDIYVRTESTKNF